MACPVSRSPLLTAPSITPEVKRAASSQSSMAALVQAGMGTVRMRFPLPGQIDYAPAAVALLDLFETQAGQFLPAEAATDEQSEQRAIARGPLWVEGSGSASSCSAWS